MAFSTSSDEMFSPPLMMISFLRSTMWMKPSSSHTRHVAGVEPGPGHDRGGDFRLAIIASMTWSPMATTSPMALHVARNVVHFRIHHADLHAGNRPARHGVPAGVSALRRVTYSTRLARAEVSTGAVSVRP